MSSSIQAHRSERRRHLPVEGFEQGSLAILSRYKRSTAGADASTAVPSSAAESPKADERKMRPQRPMTAGDR
jgi:hypothetical protein